LQGGAALDYFLIGKKIKELRKVVGLTQGDLADGICTQALISRMEKGDIYPSAAALYQIALKLGVDVNYFFEIGTNPRLDYIREVEKQFRILRDDRKFEDMIDLVKTEEKNPLFYKDKEKLQLLYWHKGIYTYEVQKDPDGALSLLHQAYGMTTQVKKAMSEREMQILSSIGTIHNSLHNHESALDFYHQVETAMKTTGQLHNKTIKTRLYYNKARILTRLGRYDASTSYCQKGIKWCFEEESLWGIGELHYQIGYNYELEGNSEKAFTYFQKAVNMFDLRNDEVYVSFLKSKIEGIRGQASQVT
jgi:transcriptional regulator with XRE-family HTH domain